MRPLYLLTVVAESLFAVAILAGGVIVESLEHDIKRIEAFVNRKSSLERTFAALCDVYHVPSPKDEYRFSSERRFRFDFAWPDKKVAVELQGGIYVHGRHTRGYGYTHDLEKHNLATALGWRILYFTAEQLRKDPQSAIGQVKALLEVDKESSP